MSRNKLRYGETLAAISATLLLAFMFLDWYGVQSPGAGFSVSDKGEALHLVLGKNAWEALDYIPIVLVAAIVATLGVGALRLTARWLPAARANAVVAILGALSALAIVFRIVYLPSSYNFVRDNLAGVTVEGTVLFPIFLALLAAIGIALGGYWAMREEMRAAGSGESISGVGRPIRRGT